MDTLLEILEKKHKVSKDALGIERHIVYFDDMPLTVTKFELQTIISKSYNLTRDNKYLMFDDQLLSKEMLRAKQKLKEGTCEISKQI